MVKVKHNLNFENATRVVNHPASAAPGDLILKSELDAAIAGLSGQSIKTPTDIDCSGFPNYPVAVAGDSFVVSVAGAIGGPPGVGVEVQVGDTIICKIDSPTEAGHPAVGGNFFILQTNTDAATETVLGLVTLASQASVNGGTGAGAVTPVTLAPYVAAQIDGSKYTQAIGDGAANAIVVTHSLNTLDVDVTIRETAAPYEDVIARVERVEPNSIRVVFHNAPTTNEFTVLVSKL